MSSDRSRFRTFLGVDLGGGKGKNTAVALLRRDGDGVVVDRYDLGDGRPWYDDRLIAFAREHAEGSVLAMDAPLTLTACVRCRLPLCPGVDACEDPTVTWFRARAPLLADEAGRPAGARIARVGARAGSDESRPLVPASLAAGDSGHKPRYTPYTQRATEVWLHEAEGIMPRETLGQGMGPLTARAAHLTRALADLYRLDENLLEVYPKATIWKLCGEKAARSYKRHHAQQAVRLEEILHGLPGLRFAPGQWREFGVQNDHLFDAVICAYTAFLWARDGWTQPVRDREVYATDGWIWVPPGPPAA